GGGCGDRDVLARAVGSDEMTVGGLTANPTVLCDQLASLGRDQHGEVLGVVELLPVAIYDEFPESDREVIQSWHSGTLTDHPTNWVSACHSRASRWGRRSTS